uniref:Uncharacterized protein n=1 Tax=Anguilla anguilla TaxID=7936 RepID=A0A0E9RDZ2_ANGAN
MWNKHPRDKQLLVVIQPHVCLLTLLFKGCLKRTLLLNLANIHHIVFKTNQYDTTTYVNTPSRPTLQRYRGTKP